LPRRWEAPWARHVPWSTPGGSPTRIRSARPEGLSPSLYIACGVSGAIQHTWRHVVVEGHRRDQQDPEAPIFKVATYGIVGDVFEVLPKLTEAIKKLQRTSPFQ
jgi:hypothetical protein